MPMTLEQAGPAPQAAHVVEAVRRPVDHSHPLRILVFGSYARGEAQAGSDVDLLVVLPTVAHKREAAIAMRRVLADLPVPCDVYVTTPEEITARGWIVGTLLRSALTEGRGVYDHAQESLVA